MSTYFATVEWSREGDFLAGRYSRYHTIRFDGAVVPGADATRPVVRVVYQDSQGRLILLDQQRLRPGQPSPTAGPLSWLIGDTALWLNGEASGEILRTYRPRVR